MGRVQIGQERRMNAHAQLCILHAAGRCSQADWNTLLHRAHQYTFRDGQSVCGKAQCSQGACLRPLLNALTA